MFDLKKDNEIMQILGLTEIRHLVAHTNKGELTIMLRKGETEHRFVLDAVPATDEENKELMKMYETKKV